MEERRKRRAVPARVRRLADLEAAIAGDEIEILFQPQVEMASGQITGVEALARWRHPQLGELGPGDLLEIAARSRVTVALSRHILNRALTLAAQWTGPAGALRLSVNITSEDIAEPDFAGVIANELASSRFPAHRLTLEITETGVIADLSAASGKLRQLRETGIRIALDDFGSGYSSLAYLRALPVDIIKLDREFSQSIAADGKPKTLVLGVIALAHALGLDVIAEGVETEQQRRLLEHEKCDYYQGFLSAEPMNDAALRAFVERCV